MKIEVVRTQSYADGIHGKLIPVGQYEVEGEMSYPEQGKVSEKCAEVFLQEGWAKEVKEPGKKDDDGRQSRQSGEDKPPASSQAAPASRKKTAKQSGKKAGEQ